MIDKPLVIAIQIQNYKSAAAQFHNHLCTKVCGCNSVQRFSKSPLLPVKISQYLLTCLGTNKTKSIEIPIICDFGLLQAFACLLLLRILTRTVQISFYTTYYHHIVPPNILVTSSFRLNEAFKLLSCMLFRSITRFFPGLLRHFFVVTVSPESKKIISHYTGISKSFIFCLYNHRFSEISLSSLEVANNLRQKSNKLLVVSNLEARKNPSLVYKIIAKYPFDSKIVVPPRKISSRTRRLAAVQNNIYSSLSNLEILELYRSSAYVVIPSFFEGLSLVPLEAIANNAIAVLSDIPVHRHLGLPDIQYFDPYSYDSFFKTIYELDKLPYSYLLSQQADAFSSTLPSIQQTMNSEMELFLRSFHNAS